MKEMLDPVPLLTNASALNIQILFDLGALHETSIFVGRHMGRTSKLIDFSLANLIKLGSFKNLLLPLALTFGVLAAVFGAPKSSRRAYFFVFKLS